MTLNVKLGSIATSVVGFFTGPFGKIGMYALLVGGVLYAGRLWLNSHDDKVAKEATSTAAVSMKKDLDKEFAIRLEANMQIVKQAVEDKQKAEARYDQVTQLFDQAFARLRDIRKAVDERQVVYVKEAAAVPASDLDPALRAVSNDIASPPPK